MAVEARTGSRLNLIELFTSATIRAKSSSKEKGAWRRTQTNAGAVGMKGNESLSTHNTNREQQNQIDQQKNTEP